MREELPSPAQRNTAQYRRRTEVAERLSVRCGRRMHSAGTWDGAFRPRGHVGGRPPSGVPATRRKGGTLRPHLPLIASFFHRGRKAAWLVPSFAVAGGLTKGSFFVRRASRVARFLRCFRRKRAARGARRTKHPSFVPGGLTKGGVLRVPTSFPYEGFIGTRRAPHTKHPLFVRLRSGRRDEQSPFRRVAATK